MKKSKNWMKYICYFIIGFLIYTILASITQIDMLKELKMEIDIKTVVLHTMKSGIVLYTIIYFLILVSNILYNLRLIKKLNEESAKIRKVGTEKILKERRSITMKKKVFICGLVIVLIALVVFSINLTRKVIIIDKYNDAVAEREKLTNYYAKTVNNGGNTREIFKKDNTKLLKTISPSGEIRIMYLDDEVFLILNESTRTVYKTENSEGQLVPGFSGSDSYFTLHEGRRDSIWEKIKLAFETKITTDEVNSKECYRLYIKDDLQAYINKEDFVAIRTINGDTYQPQDVVEYSFNTVTDEEVAKPDINGYTIEED